MISAFNCLFDQTKPAFAQDRTFERARTLAMSSLVGLGRRTVSGMLCTSAQQFSDWSAAYRLFERQRFDTRIIFAPIRQEVVDRLGHEEPLVVMMDDIMIRKRGRMDYCRGFCCWQDPFIWG